VDEACAFMNDFIAAAYAARRAVFTARSQAEFDQAKRAVNAFFDPSGSSSFHNIWDPVDEQDASAVARRDKLLARMRPAALFLVRRYRHAALGDLYRFYLDSGQMDPVRFFECYFVARLDIGWRIVGLWGVCLSCGRTGLLAGDTCDECDGTGWSQGGDKTIGPLGPVQEVRRFLAPTEPMSRADYDQD
jgi:hypothetical protein